MKPLLPLAWVIARCWPACCLLPATAYYCLQGCRRLQAAAGSCRLLLLHAFAPCRRPLQGGECSRSDFRDHTIGGRGVRAQRALIHASVQ